MTEVSPEPPIVGDNAGRIVALLGVLTVLSYVDRTMIAVLVEPLKNDMALTDVQLALLMGFGFAVTYSLFVLVTARVADSASRRLLIGIGVLIWGAATVASGWAQGFAELLVLRIGVAVGEAALTPSAISLIADLYPRDRRARATGTFLACSVAGAAGAYVLGALALILGQSLAPFTGLAPWRLAFPLVGLPSIFFGVLFLVIVREPPRRESARGAGVGMRQAVRYVHGHLHFFGPLFAGVALAQVATFSFTNWYPAMLHRSFGLAPSTAGLLFGGAAILGGVVGTLIGPRFVRGDAERLMRVAFVSAAAALVPAVLAPMVPSVGWSVVLTCLAMATLMSSVAIPPIAVQLVVPNQFRAQVAGVYGVLLGLVGMGLSPLLVAATASRILGDPARLGEAMALVNGLALLLGLITLGATFRRGRGQ